MLFFMLRVSCSECTLHYLFETNSIHSCRTHRSVCVYGLYCIIFVLALLFRLLCIAACFHLSAIFLAAFTIASSFCLPIHLGFFLGPIGDLDEGDSKAHFEGWRQDYQNSRREAIKEIPEDTTWIGT